MWYWGNCQHSGTRCNTKITSTKQATFTGPSFTLLTLICPALGGQKFGLEGRAKKKAE